ncbi:hypothetical protein M409DRAFT_25531 [Zasmidium cellare ATCC 36951]|uniref:Uncharacterized protein n=1 Tax=Zasmidium cellare ATCC 36951 TaxID=1080233 RepID=A0A6A6CFK4_ZASCE|nr:uncharacterized protein M409DRAFT_25531 [Zasmidium cellare ATCC 36951]KAF2164186.1 hypothetical protein M409DRAFT_25531 [Zasmidium cellare ATCC 36951]
MRAFSGMRCFVQLLASFKSDDIAIMGGHGEGAFRVGMGTTARPFGKADSRPRQPFRKSLPTSQEYSVPSQQLTMFDAKVPGYHLRILSLGRPLFPHHVPLDRASAIFVASDRAPHLNICCKQEVHNDATPK